MVGEARNMNEMDYRDYVVGTLARLDERSRSTHDDIVGIKVVQARIESTINDVKNEHDARLATLEERTPPGSAHVAAIGGGAGALVMALEWIVRNIR